MKLTHLVPRLSIAAAVALACIGALAQGEYPNRAVTIIVPFAAGGPADNYARFIAQRLSTEFKQPFVVDDKPGAGSVIGTDLVAKSAPDGYTLLMMSNTHTVNETLVPNKPFRLMDDFVGIAPVNYSDLMLVVHPSVPARTLPELIALARSRPGKLNYASSGTGTPYHMAGELFKHLAGVNITHIPYKGSSGARTDVVGGQVDMSWAAAAIRPGVRETNQMTVLNVLSGGAAAAVVKGVQTRFESETGCRINGIFSAVGQMREQLVGGAPRDLAILTQPLIAQLIASGHAVEGSAKSLGRVRTGIAVPTGRKHPPVASREQLADAFRAAGAIYFPDPLKATAGIHFMNVLKSLGLDQQLRAALRPYPNGAAAMTAMAASSESGPIGCTQVTEINYTPGVDLVAGLPKEFELATDYTLGVCTNARQPALARQLAQLLTGPASAAIRRKGGFEF